MVLPPQCFQAAFKAEKEQPFFRNLLPRLYYQIASNLLLVVEVLDIHFQDSTARVLLPRHFRLAFGAGKCMHV